jgi:methyl-accepting chemotaxis protein
MSDVTEFRLDRLETAIQEISGTMREISRSTSEMVHVAKGHDALREDVAKLLEQNAGMQREFAVLRTLMQERDKSHEKNSNDIAFIKKFVYGLAGGFALISFLRLDGLRLLIG